MLKKIVRFFEDAIELWVALPVTKQIQCFVLQSIRWQRWFGGCYASFWSFFWLGWNLWTLECLKLRCSDAMMKLTHTHIILIRKENKYYHQILYRSSMMITDSLSHLVLVSVSVKSAVLVNMGKQLATWSVLRLVRQRTEQASQQLCDPIRSYLVTCVPMTPWSVEAVQLAKILQPITMIHLIHLSTPLVMHGLMVKNGINSFWRQEEEECEENDSDVNDARARSNGLRHRVRWDLFPN